MRLFEYHCADCNKSFEKLLVNTEEVNRHLDSYDCDCGKPAERVLGAVKRFIISGKPQYSSNSVKERMD